MLENHSKLHKAMTVDQFTQVVDAILEGKYSWACVLILRYAGYNPLHYIPYRTYNRLMKENSQDHRRKPDETKALKHSSAEQALPKGSYRIEDLNYLETVKQQQTLVKGKGYAFGYTGAYEILRLTSLL